MAIGLGDAVLFFKGDTRHLDKTKKTMSTGMKLAMAGVVAAVGAATIKVMRKIVDFTKDAVKSAATVSEKLGNLATLGVKDMGAMLEVAKQVGLQFGFEIPESLNALYQLLSAEVPEELAPDVLLKSAMAARAGVGSLNAAVQMGIAFTKTFGGSWEDIESVFDKVQLTIKTGVTNMEELGGTAARVIPLWQALGGTGEEFLAIMAVVTGKTVKTSEAISGLKQVTEALRKPQAAAIQMAETLGFEFDAEAFAADGLAGLLGNVVTKLAEHNEKAKETVGVNDKMVAATERSITALDGENTKLRNLVGNQRANVELRRQAGLKLEHNIGLQEEMRDWLDKVTDSEGKAYGAGLNLNEVLAALFGSGEAANVVYALMSDELVGVKTQIVANTHAQGTLQQAFDDFVEANPAFAFEKLKQAIALVAVELGMALIPALAESAERAVQWVNDNRELIASIVDTAGAIANILLPMLNGLLGAVLNIIGAVDWLIRMWRLFISLAPSFAKMMGFGTMPPGFAEALAVGYGGVPGMIATSGFQHGGLTRGGLTLVGETGPEFVRMPVGSRVYSAADSRQMAGTGGMTVNGPLVAIESLAVRADSDVDRIASLLETKLRGVLAGQGA
jgi:hypothetical protein